jgi:hypothetical protein
MHYPTMTRAPFLGIGLLFLALLIAVPNGLAGAPAPSTLATPAHAAPAQGGPPLTYHANLYLASPVPAGPMSFGEELAATYGVMVPAFPSWSPPEYVVVPSALLTFPPSAGGSQVYLPAENVTIRTNASVTVAVGPAVRESARTVPPNASASLSTQGVAVSASWPTGTYSVEVRWQWTLISPNGGRTSGNWSAWESVAPAQIAGIVGSAPKVLVPGSPFDFCLNGTLQGRSFSLHLSMGANGSQLDLGNATIPDRSTPVFCWNSTISSSLSPQPAYLHVWEIDNTSFLLYVLKVQVQPGATSKTSGYGWMPSSWSGPLMLPIFLGLLVLVAVFAVVLVRRRNARRPPASPPTVWAEPNVAPPPPRAPL